MEGIRLIRSFGISDNFLVYRINIDMTVNRLRAQKRSGCLKILTLSFAALAATAAPAWSAQINVLEPVSGWVDAKSDMSAPSACLFRTTYGQGVDLDLSFEQDDRLQVNLRADDGRFVDGATYQTDMLVDVAYQASVTSDPVSNGLISFPLDDRAAVLRALYNAREISFGLDDELYVFKLGSQHELLNLMAACTRTRPLIQAILSPPISKETSELEMTSMGEQQDVIAEMAAEEEPLMAELPEQRASASLELGNTADIPAEIFLETDPAPFENTEENETARHSWKAEDILFAKPFNRSDAFYGPAVREMAVVESSFEEPDMVSALLNALPTDVQPSPAPVKETPAKAKAERETNAIVTVKTLQEVEAKEREKIMTLADYNAIEPASGGAAELDSAVYLLDEQTNQSQEREPAPSVSEKIQAPVKETYIRRKAVSRHREEETKTIQKEERKEGRSDKGMIFRVLNSVSENAFKPIGEMISFGDLDDDPNVIDITERDEPSSARVMPSVNEISEPPVRVAMLQGAEIQEMEEMARVMGRSIEPAAAEPGRQDMNDVRYIMNESGMRKTGTDNPEQCMSLEDAMAEPRIIDLAEAKDEALPPEISALKPYTTGNKNYDESQEVIESLKVKMQLLEREKEALKSRQPEKPGALSLVRICTKEKEEAGELAGKIKVLEEKSWALSQMQAELETATYAAEEVEELRDDIKQLNEENREILRSMDEMKAYIEKLEKKSAKATFGPVAPASEQSEETEEQQEGKDVDDLSLLEKDDGRTSEAGQSLDIESGIGADDTERDS